MFRDFQRLSSGRWVEGSRWRHLLHLFALAQGQAPRHFKGPEGRGGLPQAPGVQGSIPALATAALPRRPWVPLLSTEPKYWTRQSWPARPQGLPVQGWRKGPDI